jgi:hypothetical protein
MITTTAAQRFRRHHSGYDNKVIPERLRELKGCGLAWYMYS